MTQVEVRSYESEFIVLLKGESDRDDVLTLAKTVIDSLPKSPTTIGLDFSLLVSISPSLVIPLIQLRNFFKHPDEMLFLIDTPADFRFMLQVAKVHHLFQFVPSIAQMRQITRGMQTLQSQAFHPKPLIHDTLENPPL